MAAPHSFPDLTAAKRAAREAALAARAACDPALGALVAAHVLHERGHPIVLPETPKRGNPLIFRLWQPGATMVAERFGTMSPCWAVLPLPKHKDRAKDLFAHLERCKERGTRSAASKAWDAIKEARHEAV